MNIIEFSPIKVEDNNLICFPDWLTLNNQLPINAFVKYNYIDDICDIDNENKLMKKEIITKETIDKIINFQKVFYRPEYWYFNLRWNFPYDVKKYNNIDFYYGSQYYNKNYTKNDTSDDLTNIEFTPNGHFYKISNVSCVDLNDQMVIELQKYVDSDITTNDINFNLNLKLVGEYNQLDQFNHSNYHQQYVFFQKQLKYSNKYLCYFYNNKLRYIENTLPDASILSSDLIGIKQDLLKFLQIINTFIFHYDYVVEIGKIVDKFIVINVLPPLYLTKNIILGNYEDDKYNIHLTSTPIMRYRTPTKIIFEL